MCPKRSLAVLLSVAIAVSPGGGAFAASVGVAGPARPGDLVGQSISLGATAAESPGSGLSAAGDSRASAGAVSAASSPAARGMPSAAHGASGASVPPNVSLHGFADLDSSTAPALSDGIAPGVFGTYGGAESRFSSDGNRPSLHPHIGDSQLPNLGDGSDGSLTPEAERRLGERAMREIRRDPDYVRDWLVSDYLNSVAAKLAAAASAQYLGAYRPDFDVFAVRDPQINAFSMPGGFIGINTGLIVTSQTESELASVLGHEMGHVLQRHIARMISANERNGYAALASLLFGVLAGVVAHSGDLGSAIALGGQAYAVDKQLRFSRTAEHEADRVGFRLLTGAGYDPYGMVAFFQRLDRASMSDAGVPAYAQTHPLTGQRIADMEDRARRVPYRQPAQSSEYGFVRARVRLLQDNSPGDYTDEVSRLRSEIEDRTALNVAANWYGIAFGQMLLEHYDDAAASLARARAAFEAGVDASAPMSASGTPGRRANANAGPDAASAVVIHARRLPRSSPSLDVLAADIARRAGHFDEAIRLAAQARQRWPDSHAAVAMQLRTLIAAKRFAEAKTLARQETAVDPDEPEWWGYLAEASVRLGDMLTRHRAMAEKFALEGAWPSAIRQLKEARDDKTVGYYDLATIDARLHDFEARYRQEREDEKDSS